MRLARKITAEEENFRVEPVRGLPNRIQFIKRDPIKPEPEGTIVLLAFRITGYSPDCDGSLLARMEHIGFDDLEGTGWEPNLLGIYPETDIVVSEEEVKALYQRAKAQKEGM